MMISLKSAVNRKCVPILVDYKLTNFRSEAILGILGIRRKSIFDKYGINFYMISPILYKI